MTMIEHYEVLGVDVFCSLSDIKQAYRRLANKYHPDKPTGSAEKFKQITDSYQILKSHLSSPKHRTIKHTVTVKLEDVLNGSVVYVSLPNNEVALVNIPAGVQDRQRISLKNVATGFDLLLEVHIAPHHKFARRNLDLHTMIDVDVFDAMTGTTVEIECLDGKVELLIEPGTQPLQEYKISKRGLLDNKARGDVIVVVNVVIPKVIEQRAVGAVNTLKTLLTSTR